MKNDFHKILNTFLNPKCIDRKKVSLSKTTKYVSTEYEIYCGAKMIIIKNNNGRILFNEYVKFLDYKEKGVAKLQQISYPYYILSLDWITAETVEKPKKGNFQTYNYLILLYANFTKM